MNLSFNTHQLLIFLVLIFLSCSGQSKKDASDFFLKGNVALTQKNYAEAIRLYDEAIAKNPDFSDAYLNKGICLLKTNEVDNAYEVLSKAIQVDPSLLQAILVRSEAGLLSNKLNEAEQDLNQIKKAYKDSSRYFLIHGNLMQARGQSAKSLTDYDRAVSLDAGNVEALVNRGAVYYQMQSFKEAGKDFSDAIKINPFQPEALNNLGLLAIKEKDWDKAISYFDLILNSNPAEPLSLNNKGYVLIERGSLEEAKKLIDRSLDIMPKNGYAMRNLGIYFQKKGNISEAIRQYMRAIELAEPVDDVYGLAGIAYSQSGNKSEACKIWKKGIVLGDSIAIEQFGKNCK